MNTPLSGRLDVDAEAAAVIGAMNKPFGNSVIGISAAAEEAEAGVELLFMFDGSCIRAAVVVETAVDVVWTGGNWTLLQCDFAVGNWTLLQFDVKEGGGRLKIEPEAV